jgi:hypothetical protein
MEPRKNLIMGTVLCDVNVLSDIKLYAGKHFVGHGTATTGYDGDSFIIGPPIINKYFLDEGNTWQEQD